MLCLVARDELADVLEEIERQFAGLYMSEAVKPDGLTENPGRHAFFDELCSSTILRVVYLRDTLTLHPEQRSDDGGPAQHGDVRADPRS